jgi:hypothetical protein
MIADIRLFFTAGTGPVCWAIRRLDRARVINFETPGRHQSVPSCINHTGLRLIYANGPDLAFQSHAGSGVRLSYAIKVQNAQSEGRVKRYAEISLGLSRLDMERVLDRLPEIEGGGYDYRLIALYYLGTRLGLRRLPGWHHRSRYTCNEAVCEALRGVVPWINDDVWQTPERLFNAAFQVPSPVWFR